jgi:hypothetical protein
MWTTSGLVSLSVSRRGCRRSEERRGEEGRGGEGLKTELEHC